MTTGFLLLSFELCFVVVLMRVKAGVLAMKQGVGQGVNRMDLAPALAVLAISGGQCVEVSLLVPGC